MRRLGRTRVSGIPGGAALQKRAGALEAQSDTRAFHPALFRRSRRRAQRFFRVLATLIAEKSPRLARGNEPSRCPNAAARKYLFAISRADVERPASWLEDGCEIKMKLFRIIRLVRRSCRDLTRQTIGHQTHNQNAENQASPKRPCFVICLGAQPCRPCQRNLFPQRDSSDFEFRLSFVTGNQGIDRKRCCLDSSVAVTK